MKAIRRIIGILVMVAGVLGLLLSIAGLVSVWVLKPTIGEYMDVALQTFNSSIDTSQRAMEVTGQALGATVTSIDALGSMLNATADSVESTKPILDNVVLIMNDTMPSTLESASNSLQSAQQAAMVLDSAIQSLDTFRAVLSAVPLIGGFVDAPEEAYNPEAPLGESLGDLATNLGTLPATFKEMATDLDAADENLVKIQESLTIMAGSVGEISSSLREYENMVNQSQESMENMKTMLASIQTNLTTILTGAAIGLSIFFFWLLAAQVVILSQGWELYQGTATRMEGGEMEEDEIESDESLLISEPTSDQESALNEDQFDESGSESLEEEVEG